MAKQGKQATQTEQANLVERYVHQVGRYLPVKDRTEIENELRSSIQDQLDDRYAGSPTEAEIAAVLSEIGSPRVMAASYSSAQYLIGPDLYPIMMMVLRHGWLLVPTIVAFISIFGTLISTQEHTALTLIVDALLAAFQATFIFSAVVVAIFAIWQRSGVQINTKDVEFDPLALPDVDDPCVVDRSEATFGVTIGTFVALLVLYFARVGSPSFHLDLNGKSNLVTVPVEWLLLMFVMTSGMVVLHIGLLRRNRWTGALWLTETLLEGVGVICLYFVLYKPILAPVIMSIPLFANIPFIDKSAEVIAFWTAISTLITRGIKQIKIWNYDNNNRAPVTLSAKK